MPTVTELRQLIDDLATGILIGRESERPDGAPPPFMAALEEIATGAAEGGYTDLARLAEALRASAGTLPAEPEALAIALQEGVTSLQQACEEADTNHTPSSLAQDPELVRDFILESREHLSSIEAQMLTLEKDPSDSEVLNAAFRSFHTTKGLAGFLELWDVQHLAHEVETLLDQARTGELRLTAPSIDVVLESADYLRRWLDHLEEVLAGEAGPPPPRDEALLARIRAAASGGDSAAPATVVQPTAPPSAPAPHGTVAPAAEAPAADAPVVQAPVAEAAAAGVAVTKGPVGEAAAAGVAVTKAPVAEAAAAEVAVTEAPVAPAAAHRKTETAVIKVDTTKLDYLVDMAGEMVIAQSMVHHDPDLAGVKTPRMLRNLAQLGRITAELQKTAMAMRLVPVGPVFRRMARLVRDLSRQFGKQVEMETEGDEIELDRTIVEELADPLMHMVRNSLDHGIETPPERAERGKPASARLLLKAHHQAGQVVIEITDDGRGLNREKILARAIERGVVAAGQTLSDTEIFNLIFEPGFSTAAQVTNVSGRGVGMDVVRRHVQKLRGRIEIRSVAGKGTTFLLKLPLTLAIIDGLVVGVGSNRYIVPLFAVREMFRPTADVVWTVQGRGEVALVRGSLLPVMRLYRRFGVSPASTDPLECILVVAETEEKRFCVMVDELIGKQEVVIKNLGEMFKSVAGVAGGAILGDGRVGLILDLEGLSHEGRADATL